MFARVHSPEIVPLCPGCKGMTPKERPAEGLQCAGGKTLVYIEEGREMTAYQCTWGENLRGFPPWVHLYI